eukprot:scaffold68669_cov28-Tisochrysis_lutea.AAC.2
MCVQAALTWTRAALAAVIPIAQLTIGQRQACALHAPEAREVSAGQGDRGCARTFTHPFGPLTLTAAETTSY